MGAATFLSRIMGLVREQVFAYFFGAGNATDAFQVAFRIPNLLRDLFAEGAMSASFVPTWTKVRHEEGEARAWQVARRVFVTLFLGVCVLSLIGIFLSRELVLLYAGSFAAVEGKVELASRMTRILFPFFPCVALAAAFMAVLNACGRFFIPAFSSALFNVASVISGVIFAQLVFAPNPDWGWHPIEGMALGVVVGGAVQALCQLPSLARVGFRWRQPAPLAGSIGARAWHRDPALRQMLLMMVPGTLGLAATQVNILVNTWLATSQGTGAVSWLSYAFRLMQFPIGIFGVSLAAATLPMVSRFWVQKEYGRIDESLRQSLAYVFAVNLPAAVGLAVLSAPIIRVIFEHGRFAASDTEATAMALAMYAIGLPAYSAVKVLVPAFYAVRNTRIPVVSSVLSVALTVALNLAMIGPFGYWGLALGTSIAAIFNMVYLLIALRGVLSGVGVGLDLAFVARKFMVHGTLAAAMGAACWAGLALEARYLPALSATFAGQLLEVGLLIAIGVAVWSALAWIFRVSEVRAVQDQFARRLRKLLSRTQS